MVAKYVFERLCRLGVEVQLASEFRYSDPIVDERTLVILVSQSGETADTIAAMREAKRKGATTRHRERGGQHHREGERLHAVHTGGSLKSPWPRQKAFSAGHFVSAGGALCRKARACHRSATGGAAGRGGGAAGKSASHFGAGRFHPEIRVYLRGLQEHLLHRAQHRLRHCDGEPLKLKEISYIHSEAYAGGELKHGTISLVEENTLVVAISCCERLYGKILSNVEQVLSPRRKGAVHRQLHAGDAGRKAGGRGAAKGGRAVFALAVRDRAATDGLLHRREQGP